MKLTMRFTLISIIVILYLFFIQAAFAQYTVQVSAPTLIIDKLVGRPSAQTKGGALEYVDNLGTADHKFKPGDEVSFQLKVKNATDRKLENVTVQDFLPLSLDPIEGPGSFDEKSKTITINAGAFTVNEEKIYTLKMQVFSQDKLPDNQGLFCIINKAEAKVNDTTIDIDTSQLCIEKQVVNAIQTTSVGPYQKPIMTTAISTQVSTPTLTIDKMTASPLSQTKGGTLSYVDNLSAADYKFVPGEAVSFRLKIKNTTNTSLSNITVKDFVPNYLEPIEGPGSFDERSRIITFSVGDFAVNEEKIYTMKMRIASQDKLPENKSLFCITNKAEVAANSITIDDDSSQFCLEKTVVGVQKIPSAGPGSGLIMILGELSLFGFGVYLVKKETI